MNGKVLRKQKWIQSQYGLILTDEEFEEFFKSQEKTEPESAQGETTGIGSNCGSDNDNISSDHANPVVGALCKQNVTYRYCSTCTTLLTMMT